MSCLVMSCNHCRSTGHRAVTFADGGLVRLAFSSNTSLPHSGESVNVRAQSPVSPVAHGDPADQFTECEDSCMAFCPSRDNPIPAGAATCPDCASTPVTTTASAAQGQVGGLTQNVAGAPASATCIPAGFFFFLHPCQKKHL